MRDYTRVTFMFCLPRSRSQWFAWLINKSSNTIAWHDPLKRCGHPNMLVLMIDEFLDQNPDKRLFIADTAAVMFHRFLTARMPAAGRFYVHRDLTDVIASMRVQTGKDLTRFLSEQLEYLTANWRINRSFDFDTDFTLKNIRKLWMWITKGDFITEVDLKLAMAQNIDTPVRDQEANPELVRSLLAYRENA